VAPYDIRVFGDPVLKTPATEITNIDGALAALAKDMLATMYEAPGIGLAGPQVGVQKRIFVYDIGDGSGPHTVINPMLDGHDGEWTYEEGCLSVPGLYWPIPRPKTVHLTGLDLDGNALDIEADDLLARMFQHEVDHLNGTLLLERLNKEQRKSAMRELREREESR
jgi:peptide deformylase